MRLSESLYKPLSVIITIFVIIIIIAVFINIIQFSGEPVNLREQQDAVEFFMSLVESLDEALKTLGHEQIMSKILGGSYSDQKICKGCPHRYSKEEPFSVISVDIRNHSSLQDSMEQYVKGKWIVILL